METYSPSLLASLIPLITVTCMTTVPFVILCAFIADKKGFNTVLACLIAFIPIVNLPFGIWLASRIDSSVLQRLQALENNKV